MIEVNIHDMTELEALKYLEKFLAKLDDNIKEVRVIHGYHGGNKLQEMVRNKNKLRSKKIYRRKLTKNQGETILELY